MVESIGRDSVFEDEDGDGTYEQSEGDGIAPPAVDTDEVDHDGLILADPDTDAQTVIDNAPENAQIQFDRENQRVIDSRLTIDKSGQVVRGLNAKLADAADVVMVKVAGESAKLTDYILDGNKANQAGEHSCVWAAADDVEVSSGETVDASRHGILAQPDGGRVEGITIRDNTHRTPTNYGTSVEGEAAAEIASTSVENEDVFSPGKSGVEVNDNAAHTQVEDCYAYGATRGVVTYTDHGGNGCRDTTITNCHAEACARIVQANTTEATLTHENLTITDCIGENLSDGDAISVANIDKGLKIHGNTVDEPANRGIDVANCPGASIKNNTVEDFPNNYAIFVRNCPDASIDDNTCRNGQNGIRYGETDGNAQEDWSISDNRVTGCNNGIVVREATAGTVDYYHIVNNRVRGNGTAYDLGGTSGRNETTGLNSPQVA